VKWKGATGILGEFSAIIPLRIVAVPGSFGSSRCGCHYKYGSAFASSNYSKQLTMLLEYHYQEGL
jgi:hypothetical protein